MQFAEDPFRLIRFIVGALLLVATAVALLLAVTGVAPRAILLVGSFWALYGLFTGVLGGVLEPVIDGTARMFGNVGLRRAGGGYSAVETMVSRGRYREAAEAYAARAREPRRRVEATLRRGALLAGPLGLPAQAVAELLELRTRQGPLAPADDLRVGLALVDLYDFKLTDPGRAMTELRRLIDRYPESRHARHMRNVLRELKTTRFGERPPESRVD